jgi:hypothetical protein
MNSHDDDLDIPEVTDFNGFGPSRYARKTGEPLELRIDGAIGYSLRLIPSNKIVARFTSTLDAWAAVAAEVDRGIPAKCLILDCDFPDGRRSRVSSGRSLVWTALSVVRPDSSRSPVRAAS